MMELILVIVMFALLGSISRKNYGENDTIETIDILKFVAAFIICIALGGLPIIILVSILYYAIYRLSKRIKGRR